jgi:hypothetical protein
MLGWKSRRLAIALMTGALMSLSVKYAAWAADKPNILFIMGDDIGYLQPGIYHRGLMVGETPNIDRIGREGAMFTAYYATRSSGVSCNAGVRVFKFAETNDRKSQTVGGRVRDILLLLDLGCR